MENKKTATLSGITDNLRTMADASIKTVKTIVENASANMGTVNQMMNKMGLATFNLPFSKKESDCCPPKNDCPPHCLAELTRDAYAEERIVVPFGVKNECKGQKTYKVGVRELKNINGTTAPSQPVLNKNTVTLETGETEMVLMMLELKGFQAGTYNAEIVLREKDINQNICFTLKVNNYDNLTVAEPLEEIKYRLHWQSWQRHFYCEAPLKPAGIAGNNQ